MDDAGSSDLLQLTKLFPQDVDAMIREWDSLSTASTSTSSTAAYTAVTLSTQCDFEKVGALHTTCPSPQQLAASRASARPRRKSTSWRQKKEITMLRQEIHRLEAHLISFSHSIVPKYRASRTLWQSVAQNQRDERYRVEEENARLRGLIKSHTKLVHILQRALKMAAKFERVSTNYNDWLALDLSQSQDKTMISRMALSADRHLSSIRDVTNQLRWQPADHCDGRLYQDSHGSYFYERERTQLLPFDFELVQQVTWRSVRSGELHRGPIAATVSPAIDGNPEFVSKFIVRAAQFGNIETYFVVKRSRRGDQVVHVWETVSLIPELKSFGTPALQWTQRG